MKKIIIFSILFVTVVIAWERTYDTDGDFENCQDVTQLIDSSYVMVGSSTPHHGSTDYDDLIYVIKVNRSGDTIWTKKYGDRDTAITNTVARGTSICATSDGGFVITGMGTNAFSSDGVYLLKCDSNGDIEWCGLYDVEHSTEGYQAIQTSDGGYIIIATGTMGACVIRANSEGDSLWAVVNDYHYYAHAHRIAETTDSSFIAAGSFMGQIFLWKLDWEGSTIWYRTYGPLNSRYSNEILPDDSGSVIVVGTIVSTSPDSLKTDDILIMKVNSEGDSVWGYSYRDESQIAREFIARADRTYDGGIIIVANAYIYESESELDSIYMYMAKTDPMGVKEWDKTYAPGLTSDTNFCGNWRIRQTYDKDFIVSGYVWYDWEYRLGYNSDYYLIKFDSLGNSVPASIGETRALPESFAISAHPNPFNSAVTITAPAGAEIEVFDVNGRRISVISTERSDEKSPTNPQEISPFGRNDIGKSDRNDIGGEYIWHPNDNLASGVYLVRASMGEGAVSKKIIYLK